MKQVTGNNGFRPRYKVSIQQSLDGHSFSVAGLSEEFPGEEPVEVAVLTSRTLLVPTELFAAEQGAAMLAAAGLPATAEGCVINSEQLADTVAVMAASGETVRAVCAKLGDRVRFTTPLLHTPEITGPTVWLYSATGVLYIKVYDGGLRMAEVIPVSGEADIVCFVERLGGLFQLADYALRLAGADTKALHKLIGKRFKATLCE